MDLYRVSGATVLAGMLGVSFVGAYYHGGSYAVGMALIAFCVGSIMTMWLDRLESAHAA